MAVRSLLIVEMLHVNSADSCPPLKTKKYGKELTPQRDSLNFISGDDVFTCTWLLACDGKVLMVVSH